MNIIERIWNAILNKETTCKCNKVPQVVTQLVVNKEVPKIEQLDKSIYNFALKMQTFIKTGQVVPEDYTSRELEKISEDLANLTVGIEENIEQTGDLDARIAARLFILNNSLENGQ